MPAPLPTPTAPRLERLPQPPAKQEPDLAALARARACKVFDRNGNGVPDWGEPAVEGWRFRLSDAREWARVRATAWNGCTEFTGLRPGRYFLSEVPPPVWGSQQGEPVGIDVTSPAPGEAPTTPVRLVASGSCVHYARMASADYWSGPSGLRLLVDQDRRFINSLQPFRAPSPGFSVGDEPFDGRFADGVTPVSAARSGSRAWGAGTWESELALFLADRAVSADPRGRLAQEILVFALNAHHFLEDAQVVYIEDLPIGVDDLLFEGILAWRSDSPGWNHEMTALLAALNGAQGLAYVPRQTCQVAYLPF